jgi:hypothetical protein
MTSLEQVKSHSTNVLFSDAEYGAQEEEIEARRIDAANALSNAIETLIGQGFTTEDATFHIGYSVHGFLPRSGTRNRVIHIELNPNSQRFGLAKVRITELDSEKLQKIREAGLISTGAEDAAITRFILPSDVDRKRTNTEYPVLITADALTSLLDQAFEQLDIADDKQQLNKARGLARIKKLFSR